MKTPMKLIKTLVLLLGMAIGVQAPLQAQSFPNKPVSLMVPYPAGGLSDIIARKITVPLAAELKQPVIIENLGGAGGAIAAQKVMNAPADGYFLFQGSPNELILAPLAMKAVKHTPGDFRLIQRMAMAPMAIVASKNFPANNPQEMVAEIVKRAKAGKPVNYASVGIGSFYHLLNVVGSLGKHWIA
jgi:tripartite-type tricarboxylate transporter receptor subunit TctC